MLWELPESLWIVDAPFGLLNIRTRCSHAFIPSGVTFRVSARRLLVTSSLYSTTATANTSSPFPLSSMPHCLGAGASSANHLCQFTDGRLGSGVTHSYVSGLQILNTPHCLFGTHHLCTQLSAVMKCTYFPRPLVSTFLLSPSFPLSRSSQFCWSSWLVCVYLS